MTWYVDQQVGSDNNHGRSIGQAFQSVEFATANALKAGDTLFIKGIYTNSSYDSTYQFSGNIQDPFIWKKENTIRINNLHGKPGQYISLKPYDQHTVLKGDGANIFRMVNASYVRIEGFEMEGEVEKIPLSTALALQFVYKSNNGSIQYRVPPGTLDSVVERMTLPALSNISRPSYTDTRGIYLTDVHHIDIIGNHIHHTPGTGLRVAVCDHINIIGNEVNDCSRKSYSGTHALVVTKAKSLDTDTTHKIFILQNKIHHNYNEIYSWAPTKTFITPKIDEGKGISLQRNTAAGGWTHGRFWVANNLCYWNGYSGIHSNGGTRMDFVNNTCYLNSFTGSITDSSNHSTGNNIGISSSDGQDIRILNNIIVVDASFGGFAISVRNTAPIQVSHNMIYGVKAPLQQDPDVVSIQNQTVMDNPLLVDPMAENFQLQPTSPAIGIANPLFAPTVDYAGKARGGQPDLGALEYQITSAIKVKKNVPKVIVFPNPTKSQVHLRGDLLEKGIDELVVFTLSGKEVTNTISIIQQSSSQFKLDFSQLPQGVYLIQMSASTHRVVKK